METFSKLEQNKSNAECVTKNNHWGSLSHTNENLKTSTDPNPLLRVARLAATILLHGASTTKFSHLQQLARIQENNKTFSTIIEH